MKETREVVFEENNHKEAMGDCKIVVVVKNSMCPDYIGHEDEILKIMNEQKLYDMTLRLE